MFIVENDFKIQFEIATKVLESLIPLFGLQRKNDYSFFISLLYLKKRPYERFSDKISSYHFCKLCKLQIGPINAKIILFSLSNSICYMKLHGSLQCKTICILYYILKFWTWRSERYTKISLWNTHKNLWNYNTKTNFTLNFFTLLSTAVANPYVVFIWKSGQKTCN